MRKTKTIRLNLTVILSIGPEARVDIRSQMESSLYSAAVGDFTELKEEYHIFLAMEEQPSTRDESLNINF